MAECCSGRIALRVGLAWTLLIACVGVLMSVGFHVLKCFDPSKSKQTLDCFTYQREDDKAKYDEHDCFHVESDIYRCVKDTEHVRTIVYVSYLLVFLAAACVVSVGFMRPSQSAQGQQVVRRVACCSTWTKIVAVLSLFVLGMGGPGLGRFLARNCISPAYHGCFRDELDDDEATFERNECFEVIHETNQCITDGFQNKDWKVPVLAGYACMVLSIVVSSTLCCCQPEQHRIAQQRRVAPEAMASKAAPPCNDVTAPLVTRNPEA